MVVFVKSLATYRTIKQATVISSDLVMDSLTYEASTIKVSGMGITRSDAGSWLVVDGTVFRISDVRPAGGNTTLTLESPLDAFQRPLELETQPVTQTVGGFVSALLQSQWAACDDPVYAMPYLVVSNLDTTPFVPPETDESASFTLPDYVRLMRKTYRTTVQFSDEQGCLACTVFAAPAAKRQISFEDGRSKLTSVTYSVSGLAKLTAIQDIDTGEKDASGNPIYVRERSTWYLSEGGEISQLIPARRAPGEWGQVYLKGSDDVRTKVAEKFAKNKTDHKLEFWSTIDLPVQADCTFMVHDQLLHSHISYKRKSNDESRYFYKSGELATTVTEKLKGAMK